MINPRRKLFKWIEPSLLAKKLTNDFGEDGLIWLDGDGADNGRWATMAVEPLEQICSHGSPTDASSANPFNLLRSIRPGHWTGWLSYEAAAWIEPLNPWKKDSMATLWMARHDPVLKLDLQKKELWLEGCNDKRFIQMEKWLEGIDLKDKQINQTLSTTTLRGIPIESWEWLTPKNQYQKSVKTIKNWIQKGDIFQANLSTCCVNKKPLNSMAIDFFIKLRKTCPSPFSGLIVGSNETTGEAIISTSPERFLEVLPNGEIETRPIKGTRPRSSNYQKDADMAADLISSPKDRAENIMIVDLLRNDLGKVCQPGSIYVSELLALESYSKVHHLTSVIKGNLQENKTWVDVLEASWPGGSISGAPKLRACQRLHELEPMARGPYCGSLIHLNWDGKFDSNILIRSLMMNRNTLRVHAGCGIVADSEPEHEAEELNWKLIPLLKALE